MEFKKLIVQSIIWRGMYFATVLLLNILLSRYFKATGTGFIYYISNYFSFILLLGSLCLEAGMSFYGSQKKIAYQKLAVFSLVWSGFICVLLFFFLNLTYHPSDSPVSKQEFIFFSFNYISGILLTTFFCALFYAKQDFVTPNLIMSVTNIMLMALFPLGSRLGSGDFMGRHFLDCYFFNFLLQGLLICFAFIYRNRKGAPFRFPERPELRMIFSYSLVALSGNIIFFLLYRIDYWFINNTCRVCAAEDLGNYIQVSKLGQLFFVVPGIIGSAVFPRTAGGQKEEVFSRLELLTKGLLMFTGSVCLLLIFTGRFLFPFVFGATFEKMYVPFVVLIPGILAIAALHPVVAYYSGRNRLRTNLEGSIIALVLIATGDALFIPQYGIVAAAAVSTVGYTVYYLYVLLRFRSHFQTSVRGFFYPKHADLVLIKKWIQDRLGTTRTG